NRTIRTVFTTKREPQNQNPALRSIKTCTLSPTPQAPAAASIQKKLTCMFIPDGQVSITAQIDRKGFCEGENININAKFENTCSRIVVPKAANIAKHTFDISGHTKVLRQKLTAVRGNPIISGMCDMWQGRTFRVPKLKPTLLGCDIIKVDYSLMIYCTCTFPAVRSWFWSCPW
ncbi:thioredoxin-interacting protein, partial [Austrofundulus limnaeus]|uniref:Thioredoxin-interacting protein n=1 Tax=Austrofundulus limnaeus TaxID=52670 RepID=A0A2I4DCI1_AUSLI